MLRLKKVSCVHDIREGKDDLPMTLTAHFHGVAAGTGCSLRIMLSPDDEQKLAWQELETQLRRTVVHSMKSQGYHDVEEFYQDDPECTCESTLASVRNLHLKGCPLYQPT